jgi:hypothetical protein
MFSPSGDAAGRRVRGVCGLGGGWAETDQVGSSVPPARLPNRLPPGRPTCACGRTARRDKTTCFFCAPDISDERKLQARRGRPALDLQMDLGSAEGRLQARQQIAEAALRDEVPPSQAQIALKAIEGAMAEEERQRRVQPSDAKLIQVEVQRFGGDLKDSEPSA